MLIIFIEWNIETNDLIRLIWSTTWYKLELSNLIVTDSLW